MTTTVFKGDVVFGNLSTIDYASSARSCLGEVSTHYGPFSFSSGFIPGVGGGGGYRYNPQTASIAELSNLVSTLIAVIFRKRTGGEPG